MSDELTEDLEEYRDIKAYDLLIMVLAIVVAAATTTRLFMPDEDELSRLLDKFDYAICGIFLFDFLRSFVIAPRKLRYLFTWGLLDLVSSIPTVGPFRYLKLAQAIRIIRVVRSFRILMQVVHRDRPAAALGFIALIGMSAFVGICIGVLHFERNAPDSTIKTGDDVVWWAIETVSTVGYGDEYPVTNNGRILASLLMVVGIGAFATSTTALGVFFRRIQPTNFLGTGGNHNNIDALHSRMERIEKLLSETRHHIPHSKSTKDTQAEASPPPGDPDVPPKPMDS